MNISINVKILERNTVIHKIPLTLKDDVLESMFFADDEDTEISPTSIRYRRSEVLTDIERKILKQETDDELMMGYTQAADSAALLSILEKFHKLLNKQMYKSFVTDFTNPTEEEGMKEYYFRKYTDLIASMNQLVGVLKLAKEMGYQVQLESQAS
jgi:polyphosphate kinase 2 (PPK2 family)